MGEGCSKKLIQNHTLDERKNEVNGSNHEINQKILFLFCSVKGSKNKILDYLENFIAHGGGV